MVTWKLHSAKIENLVRVYALVRVKLLIFTSGGDYYMKTQNEDTLSSLLKIQQIYQLLLKDNK